MNFWKLEMKLIRGFPTEQQKASSSLTKWVLSWMRFSVHKSMKISISSEPFKWFRNYFCRVWVKRAPTVVKRNFLWSSEREKNHLEIKVEKTSQKSYDADPEKKSLKLRFSSRDLSVRFCRNLWSNVAVNLLLCVGFFGFGRETEVNVYVDGAFLL